MRPEMFAAEQKARNFAYYEPLVTRLRRFGLHASPRWPPRSGGSTWPMTPLAEAALMDLRDVERNTWDRVLPWRRLSRGMDSAGGGVLRVGGGQARWPSGPACQHSRAGSGWAPGAGGARPRFPPGRAKVQSCWTAIRSNVVHHGKEFQLGGGSRGTWGAPPVERPAPAAAGSRLRTAAPVTDPPSSRFIRVVSGCFRCAAAARCSGIAHVADAPSDSTAGSAAFPAWFSPARSSFAGFPQPEGAACGPALVTAISRSRR